MGKARRAKRDRQAMGKLVAEGQNFNVAPRPFEHQFTASELRKLLPRGEEPIATRISGDTVHIACASGKAFAFKIRDVGMRMIDKPGPQGCPQGEEGPEGEPDEDAGLAKQKLAEAAKKQQDMQLDKLRKDWQKYQERREQEGKAREKVENFDQAWEMAQGRCDEAVMAGTLSICSEAGCAESPDVSLVVANRAVLLCEACGLRRVSTDMGHLDADPEAWEHPR